METLGKWTDQIVPWLMSHGIRILLIIIVAFLLDRILQRLLVRAIKASVKADENTSAEAEKRERIRLSGSSAALSI